LLRAGEPAGLNTIFLWNTLSNPPGAPDTTIAGIGAPGDLPIAGAWTGAATGGIGLVRPDAPTGSNSFFLWNSAPLAPPFVPDTTIVGFGATGDKAVTGHFGNSPPVVNPATFSVVDASPNGTVVGTVTFTDPDVPVQNFTFSIQSGNTGGAFAIDASSGQITVATSSAITSANSPFSLLVRVTDDGTPEFFGEAIITVNVTPKQDQTISFTSSAPAGAVVGGPTYDVTATATSGLTVTFTIDASAASVCSIAGSTVSFIGVGTCVINANQPGDVTYNPAPQVQQSFAVGQGSQTISFTSSAPAGAVVGGPTYNVTATGGGSGNPVTFTIDAAASTVCSIAGSTVSFIGVGTCVINANQAGNANYTAAPQVQQSFAVGQGAQAITFTSTAPTDAVVGGPTYNVTANGGGSGNPVTFAIDATATSVCSIVGSTVSFGPNGGTCVINANQAGNVNYAAAPQVQQSFPVKQAPAITSADSVTVAPGIAMTPFNVTTTGVPTNTITRTDNPQGLPTGVAFLDNGNNTATISGTPAAGTQAGSPYNWIITAANGVLPNATQSFTFNVVCPTITVSGTTPLNLVFNTLMTPTMYTQSGGNGTIAWSASGLPAGLGINGSSGQLSGTPTATGVFNATITATDVGGCIGTQAVTINVAPVANGDSYNGLVDNTQFVITGGTTGSPGTPFVGATGTLISNDQPSGQVSATTGTFATSAGGSVTIAADGTFIYTPKANPTAARITSDSFTYTVSSNTGGTAAVTSAAATVNLALVGRVWYVLNTAADGGNGQSQAPFDTLAEAVAASTAGTTTTNSDTIFVYQGDGTTTKLATASVLKAFQRFIGQGAALVVNGNTLVSAGGFPLIGNTLTFASDVVVNGIDMSTGASSALVGADTTNLDVTVRNLTTSTGTALNLSGATHPTGSVTVSTVTTSGGGAGAVHVSLTNSDATVALNGGSLAGAGANIRAIDINGGTGAFTYPGTISNTGSTGTNGGGISIANKTGTSTVSLSGSTKTLNTGSNTAFNVSGNSAGTTVNVTGGGLDIDTTTGAGFNATGAGTVSVSGSGNSVTTTSGAAVNITITIGTGVTFQSVSHNGNNTAITLANTGSGPFSVTGTGSTGGSGGTIQNIVGADAVSLSSTGGLVTLNNMIIQDISAANDSTAAQNTVSGIDGIQGTNVNAGLSLDNTVIRRISDNAINGSGVWDGLTINNSTIEDTNRFHVASKGDANNEGSVRILGIRGTVNVTNSLFQRGAEFLDFFVTAGTLNMTVTNSQFLNAYKEFTAADLSSLASVGNHGIDVTVQGSGNANVTIGDRNNAALGNTFLNGRLGSVRVGNDAGATGTVNVTLGRNTFQSNDHTSGVFCNPGCQSADFDFPMAGVLLFTLGTTSSVFNAIVDNNVFNEVTNASGGVGQLTLAITRAIWQALVTNNTFDTPGNAPWFLRADANTTTAKVKFLNNTGIKGAFCSTDPAANGGGCNLGAGQLCPGAAGYCGPGLRALADVQNGGKLDLTIDGDDFAEHDAGFDPGQTFEARSGVNLVGASTACVNLKNNTAPDGYSLEQFDASQTLNVFTTGGSGTCTAPGSPGNCQNALNANLNKGGSNNANTTPPFVNVVGTVNVVSTACLEPTLP
jgi:hypothetical protein